MAPPSVSPWSVYEEHLGNRGYGKPLWLPEPDADGGPQVGDVGYTLEGKFIPIFNVIHPRQGQPAINGFVPLQYNEKLLSMHNDDYLDPIPYVGGQIKVTKMDASGGAGAGPAGAGAGFKISNNKQQGALLLLKETGALDRVLPSQRFVDYFKTHYKNWWDCIKQEFDNDVFKKDDIILISGVIKTPTWSMASFMEKGVDYELSFQGQFGPIAQAGAGFSRQHETHTSATTRDGPKHRLNDYKPGEPKDQTIFIHYYKVKFRYILPMKVVASGQEGASEDGDPNQEPDAATSPQVEEVVEPEYVPGPSTSTDPLDTVLDYILAQSEDAEMAITSTGDILELCGGPTRWPQNMREFLEIFLPRVETSDSEEEGTKVAYLSITDMIVRKNALIFAANEVEVIPPPQPAPRPPTPAEEGKEEGEEGEEGAVAAVEAVETAQAIEAVEAAEAIEAVERVERLEGAERPEGAEQSEGAEQPGGTEQLEGAERLEGVERLEGTERLEGVERLEGIERLEGVERLEGGLGGIGREFATGGQDDSDAEEDDEPKAGPSRSRPGDDLPMVAPITMTKEVPESLRGGGLVLGRILKEGVSTDWPHRVFLEDAAEGGAVCSLVVSPDARYAAAGYEDGCIRVWNMEVIAMTHKLSGHNEAVWGLACSPDGNTLLSGGADHNGMLWDLHRASTEDGYEPLRLCGHNYDVWSVAMSPNGTTAATGSVDNKVKFWNPETGQNYATMAEATAVVIRIEYSPDGTKLAAAADSTGHVYDVATGSLLASLKGHDGVIWTISWSHDGRRLITGSEDHTARIWDAENGDELVTIREHTGPVWTASFSPDDQDVATGSYDAAVAVCNSLDGTNRYLFKERPSIVNDVVYSPDGQYLAAGCADGSIKLWEMNTGDLLAEIQGHKDKVKDVTFTRDCKNMVSGSDDGTVRVWGMVDILRVV